MSGDGEGPNLPPLIPLLRDAGRQAIRRQNYATSLDIFRFGGNLLHHDEGVWWAFCYKSRDHAPRSTPRW